MQSLASSWLPILHHLLPDSYTCLIYLLLHIPATFALLHFPFSIACCLSAFLSSITYFLLSFFHWLLPTCFSFIFIPCFLSSLLPVFHLCIVCFLFAFFYLQFTSCCFPLSICCFLHAFLYFHYLLSVPFSHPLLSIPALLYRLFAFCLLSFIHHFSSLFLSLACCLASPFPTPMLSVCFPLSIICFLPAFLYFHQLLLVCFHFFLSDSTCAL